MSETFGVTAHAVRDLGLRDTKDLPIFHAARKAGIVLMSKDSALSCSWSDLVRHPRFCGLPVAIPHMHGCETSCARAFQKLGHVWSRESHSSKLLMRANRAREGHKVFMKRIWLPSSHGPVEGYR